VAQGRADPGGLSRLVREEDLRDAWPHVVRVVAAWCGSLDAGEEYAAEAFSRLVSAYPSGSGADGPDDVAAWCVQVAKRAYLDDRRRSETFARLVASVAGRQELLPPPDDSASELAGDVADDVSGADVGAGLDDRLALLFVACDDALPEGAQLVLALRVVCGLTMAEVAHHLGIQQTAAAARLTRAKKALAAARGEFRVPDPEERRRRLPVVLDCVSGMFTVAHREGFTPEDALADMGGQALSIADALVAEFPAVPDVRALRALILLGLARRPGRTDADGVALTLDEVDRSRWDGRLVEAGLRDEALAVDLLGEEEPGRYVLEAAISGLHTVATSVATTDWARIVRMYDALEAVWPSPAVRVAALAARARAVPAAVAEVEAELARLAEGGPSYAQQEATYALADLRWRTGRREEASAMYAMLAELARSEPVRRFCLRRAMSM
jgi:RNA polymerase sigma-70 factor (ECF subfamily)